MKRLFLLALFALAGWYAWNHRDRVLASHDRPEAVIENDASFPVERVRLTVDGRTMVRESIPPHENVVIPFTIQNDSDFRLVWRRGNTAAERHWRGGMATTAAIPQRHVFQIDNDGTVMYHTEPKGMAAAGW